VQRDQRGAIGSAVAAVAVCLLVGVASGYAASELTRPRPTHASEAAPIEAGSPSVPTVTVSTPTPTGTVLPDPDQYPPLDFGDLSFAEHKIGTSSETWSYEAPTDWRLFDTHDTGYRWTLPGNPDFTYSMRVNPLTVPSSTAALAQARYDAIAGATGNSGATQVEISDHDVALTYVSADQHLRYQHTYFISPPGSTTGVFEVTVSGRIRDQQGLDDLLEYVVSTVHKV
jgi:hypothetical protein